MDQNRQEFAAFRTLHKELDLDQQAFTVYFRVVRTQFGIYYEKYVVTV